MTDKPDLGGRRPSRSDSKAVWRRWAKTVRAGAPNVQQDVLRQLRAWQPYGAARHILIYLAFGDEIDIGDLQRDSGKTFYTTRTWKNRAELSVHPVAAGLETHPFGYLQPRADAPETDPTLIDLALVPGLCFGRTGGRIGYGRGYYDRLLPTLRAAAPRVGVTLEALIVPDLPQGPFDRPVSHLVSDAGIHAVSQVPGRY